MLDAAGTAAPRGRATRSRAGPGPGAARRPRLRRLPHRSARRRRRAARPEAAARPGPPDRRRSPADGAPRSACPGSAGRAASAATALSGRENLCDRARFTGYDLDGGYAELRRRRRALLLPDPGRLRATTQAAPLLCAGLIGYRSLRMAGDAERLGLYGFGAAAHIVAQVARHQGRRVFAFTRAGDDGGAGVRARARRRVGGRLGRAAARGARRGDHLRPGRRARPGRAARRSRRAARSSAPAST